MPVTFEEGTRLPSRMYCGGPTKDHILESACGGVALFDYDGDGRLDIYLVTGAELTPAASASRIATPSTAISADGSSRTSPSGRASSCGVGQRRVRGDADGDGRLDLYVTNWGTNLLYRNRGDGTFEEVAARAGVAAGGWSTGCTFFDADADGDLDLYVARYVETTWDSLVRAKRTLTWRDGPHVMVGPAGLPGESDLFFENVGKGRFVEATEAHGLSDPSRAYGFGVVATDYDNDGSVDLFVANDSNPNFLYRNLGNGRFESTGLAAGVGVNGDARAQAGMGADAGDYDGDGRMDLLLTTFAQDRYTIYHNLDGRQFEDVSMSAGIAGPTFVRMGWGAAFFDADLDGKLDLFFANGHIFPDVDQYPQLRETYRQKNQLLLNLGTRFRDVSERAGAGLQIARGRPRARRRRSRQRRRSRPRRRQHGRLADRAGEPPGQQAALGGDPRHRRDGEPIRDRREGHGQRRRPKQLREIRSGGSFLSQNDLRAYFGLGDYAGPVDVEIRLPGDAAGRGNSCRATASTCSRCRNRPASRRAGVAR